MKKKGETMNEFLDVNLTEDTINFDSIEKKNKNPPESTRSSLNLEDLNYFAEISDNENLKKNFLNDNLFPIELVRQQYSPSIDEPMTLKDVAYSSFYLGLTNFGVMQVKEKKTFLYFVVKRKLMDEYTFIKLFSLSELLPGATLIQILLIVYYIKTKSFFYSILGIILFLIPGITCLTFAYLLISKLLLIFHENELFLILEVGVAQSGLSLLLNFLTFQFIKLLNSNFQSGIVIITVGTLLVKDNLLIMLLLFCVMGYLSMRKSEHEILIQHLDYTINKAIRYSPSYYRYIALLMLCLCFLFLCFISYVFDIDSEHLFFKFYTMGNLIFMDYSTLNFLDSYLNITLRKIIIAFGFICLFQGHVFNLLIVLMMDKGFFYMFGYLIVLYFPTILYGYAGLKGMHKINSNLDLQLFLKGMRTTSLGFIFSIVPSLWQSTCLENNFYHWVFGTIIVLNGWYWFYKRKFLIGTITTICSSIIVSLLTQHFSKNNKS